MVKYTLKRILLIIPVCLGIAFIIFAIMNLTPGDPARIILGQSATAEAVEQLREELHLNDPFFKRFIDYLGNIITKGDFGNSYRTSKPVLNEILNRFPVSLKLAICGMITSCIFGIPLGILAAVKQYSKLDSIVSVLSMTIVAMPAFWVAMVLIVIFSLKLGILPASGAVGWKCYILPSITLMLANGCSVLRITRSTMLDTIRMDYVRTARAKGVPEPRIVFKHSLQNALLPIITTVGTIFGSLLGGAIVCETVFSMPGLGSLIVLSIKSKDTPMVTGSIIFLAMCYSIIMLVVDLLYAVFDPRIKARYKNS